MRSQKNSTKRTAVDKLKTSNKIPTKMITQPPIIYMLSKGKPLQDDRDLGAGRGRQRGDKQTRDMAVTGMWRGTTGDGRDLGSRYRKAR